MRRLTGVLPPAKNHRRRISPSLCAAVAMAVGCQLLTEYELSQPERSHGQSSASLSDAGSEPEWRRTTRGWELLHGARGVPRTSPSAVPLDSPAAGLKFRWERLHPLLVVALQLLAVAAASVLPVRSLQTVRRRP